jgi:hypothetical protein
MIDPGSAGDWLQATLLATALGALAITGRRALHKEETDQATAQVVPVGVGRGWSIRGG